MKNMALLSKVASLFFLASIALFSSFLRAAPDAKLDKYWNQSNPDNPAQISHEKWQDVLDEYLITDHASGINRVDYQGLLEDEEHTLASYIDNMTAIDPRDYHSKEQFAYWVNLYNALTVKLIVDNYPVASITKLGKGFFSFGPWDDTIAEIAGKEISLNDIEHRILRPIWQDHRIHFAVNCASIGCPNLLAKTFTGSNSDELLERAAKDYLAHPRGLQFRKGKLVLSSIFDWYRTDFGANKKSMLSTLSQHLPSTIAEKLANYEGRISYEYDWGLNKD